MTNVAYTVSPNYRVGSDPRPINKNSIEQDND
jgi:hypothetical protein